MHFASEVKVVSVFDDYRQTFSGKDLAVGDCEDNRFGTLEVQTWNGGDLKLREDASHFVTVLEGKMSVEAVAIKAVLSDYCYGSFAGAAKLTGSAHAVVVSCVDYQCMTLFGGPLEAYGRLRHAHGCTTSLLLSPPFLGEPCLSFLNVHAGTHQPPLTHPSIRIGMVVSGHGRCGTASEPLVFEKGSVFIVPPDTLHSFQTDEANIRIVLFQAESVFGPSDTDELLGNQKLRELK